jgi:hypothetical protein
MCPLFVKKYSSNINFNSYGWIINTKKESVMVVFKWRDGRAYISDGRWVSNKNGITHPRTVHLYFEGVHNRFSMYPVRMSALTNTVMPPPPLKCGRSIWALRPMTYFRTTIDPKKVYVDITYYYYR